MKKVLHDNGTYILTCARGEEVMGALALFAEQESIEAASFFVIGAVNEVEIAWYNLHEKEYTTKSIKEDLEIAGMFGNVAKFEGNTVIHNHGVFSDKEMKVYGGHVNKLVVSAACEVSLCKLEGRIERKYSEEIGLNLMHG